MNHRVSRPCAAESRALPVHGCVLQVRSSQSGLVATGLGRPPRAERRSVLGVVLILERVQFSGGLAHLDEVAIRMPLATLMVTGGGPSKDKPDVTFAPPVDPNTVSHELTMRVPDCQAAYKVLKSRGAE